MSNPRALRDLSRHASERRAVFYVLFALFLAVQCVPFLLTQTPALLDYPNHLARVYVLSHWAANPWFQQFYQIHWRPIPNLAFDGLGILLTKALPIFVAGQIILIATVAIIATGVLALSAALHGRAQSFCVVAFLFIFSDMFLGGMIGDLLGFGVCLWGIAIWLELRGRSPALVIAGSSCIALIIFFAHLFAFAAYALIIACLEATFLSRSDTRAADLGRALPIAAPQFVLPALIFLLLSPSGLKAEAFQFGPLITRFTMVLSPVRNYSDALDIFTFLVFFGFFSIGLLTKRLAIARDMLPTLIVLAIVSALIPDSFASGDAVEIRLPTLGALILAGSCRWQARKQIETPILALLFAALFVVRTLVVVHSFDRATHFVDGLQRAIAMLPEGSKVATITFTTAAQHRIEPEWPHYACLAVIEKSALVPSLYANPAQQPLLIAPQYKSKIYPPDQLRVTPGTKFPLRLLANVDYLIAINERVLDPSYLAALKPMFRGGGFTLYRVPH